jgi:hypothetical protein
MHHGGEGGPVAATPNSVASLPEGRQKALAEKATAQAGVEAGYSSSSLRTMRTRAGPKGVRAPTGKAMMLLSLPPRAWRTQ